MRNLGRLIVAKGFKKLPKVQKIAQSGHTAHGTWVQQLLLQKNLFSTIYKNLGPIVQRFTLRLLLNTLIGCSDLFNQPTSGQSYKAVYNRKLQLKSRNFGNFQVRTTLEL